MSESCVYKIIIIKKRIVIETSRRYVIPVSPASISKFLSLFFENVR
jgi:hypothetical protein